MVEGERLRIKKGASLSPALLAKVKENKEHLIDIVSKDNQAIINGFVIGIPGTIYTRTLNNKSSVYIEMIGDRWGAWRETYQKNQTVYAKVIASGTFEEVVKKASNYFDYLEKKKYN